MSFSLLLIPKSMSSATPIPWAQDVKLQLLTARLQMLSMCRMSAVIIYEDSGGVKVPGVEFQLSPLLICRQVTNSATMKLYVLKPNCQGSHLRSAHACIMVYQTKHSSCFLIILYLINFLTMALLAMKICEGRDHNVLFTIICSRSSIVPLTQ